MASLRRHLSHCGGQSRRDGATGHHYKGQTGKLLAVCSQPYTRLKLRAVSQRPSRGYGVQRAISLFGKNDSAYYTRGKNTTDRSAYLQPPQCGSHLCSTAPRSSRLVYLHRSLITHQDVVWSVSGVQGPKHLSSVPTRTLEPARWMKLPDSGRDWLRRRASANLR